MRFFNVQKTEAQLQALTYPFADLTQTLDIDFAKRGPLDPRLTFTRASTATYVDRSGVVRPSAVNQPRSNEHGLLIEHQRTNLLLHSTDLSNAVWGLNSGGGNSITRTANAAIAPDGNTTATLFSINIVDAAQFAAVAQSVASPGTNTGPV